MQSLTMKAAGLYTHPNNLGSVPEGALAVADNVVIDKEGIIEPRRGNGKLPFAFAGINDRADKLFTYQNKLLAHYSGTTLAYYDVATGWIPYSGTYTPPDANLGAVRAIEAQSNLYFCTSTGIQKLDRYNGTIVPAGMYSALDVTATTNGVSGFMATNTQVAYRVVWGITDANNNLILGTPSQRSVVANSSGGTVNVSLAITIPSGITTNHFFQIYRSPQSAASSTEPSDEMQQVYESNPTSGQISAGTITVIDTTPDSLRQATLYTSPSQQGILQGNESPPFAKDIALFKNMLFLGNVKSKQRLNLSILGVGGTGGIALNDTVTIAGVTYTAKSSETVASNQYKLDTGGTPAQNIANTALSLVRVINQSASTTSVYAYYESGYQDLPGKILIEERGIGGTTFAVVASANGTAYSPTLPTSGTSVSSSNDTFLNGLFVSKVQQPDAVPLTNVLFVGSASKEILRAIPLRDALFVLKEDGIFQVTGTDPTNLQVNLLDSTTKLLAPESAVVLNNSIYALTDQGVVAITDTGVQVISRPIEISLLQLTGQNLTTLKQVSFGISYESERKYILFVPSNASDTFPTQAFVHNSFTNSWTRWTLSKQSGIVNPTDNLLYLGNATSNSVTQERKSYTFTDYIDEGADFTIGPVVSNTFTIPTGVSGINVGDLVFQSSILNSIITAVDAATNTITTLNTVNWNAGTVTVFASISSLVEWVPQTGGNPGLAKHFREVTLLFKNNYFPSANIGFYSEISTNVENTLVAGSYGGLWGLFGWGGIAWGGKQTPGVIRTYVPLEKQRCSQLSVQFQHSTAYSQYQIEGLSVFFNQMSERTAV